MTPFGWKDFNTNVCAQILGRIFRVFILIRVSELLRLRLLQDKKAKEESIKDIQRSFFRRDLTFNIVVIVSYSVVFLWGHCW